MEAFFIKMMDIVATGNAPLEYRENALQYLVGFFRDIVYLPHELFFNYDCDPTASNLLEDLLQLFSKNCFASATTNPQQAGSTQQSSVFTPMHLLSLDAQLTNLKSLQKAELCKEACLTLRLSPGKVAAAVVSSEKPKTHKRQPSLPQHFDVGLASSASEHVVVQISEDDSDTASQPEPAAHDELVAVLKFPKTAQEIEQLKTRKQLIWQACELFNAKPAKGIEFMQQHNMVHNDQEIAAFIHANAAISFSRIDKRVLGDYLSDKNNSSVFEAFVAAFPFDGLRIDEALRMFLESFRLPGEAGPIHNILEKFAQYWHEANGCPFADKDAAFTLAYGIIMLNVDQHNSNVRKQTNPMTSDQFKSNLRGVNGGKDFEATLLQNIYQAIKNNEIVMPAEQTGIVRERYLWKCLLRASEGEFGAYWCADEKAALDAITGEGRETCSLPLYLLNGQLFAVAWGPTVAAITFIFDKINVNHNSSLTRRILNNGFNSCALLCATYGHLDNLIVSLCKFTVNSTGDPTNSFLTYKSQLAAHCLFGITREYANEMRASWTNVVQLILSWFKAKFLDDSLEIEDFALEDEKIKIRRRISLKPQQKNPNEGGSNFLTSFYSYFAGGQQEQLHDAVDGDKGIGDKAGAQPVANETAHLINSVCQPLAIIEESKVRIAPLCCNPDYRTVSCK